MNRSAHFVELVSRATEFISHVRSSGVLNDQIYTPNVSRTQVSLLLPCVLSAAIDATHARRSKSLEILLYHARSIV